ncbi:helix-turn-helix domain-containing protein [Pasteurella multocida]|uniref:helix-turn-helix domain-containing protein n=1 Tax=Pasteurella multocida TaxID=747 RepID=UPI0007ED8753|nr:helix-turn-helix domain-containing protein [Pasteurella multocida]MCL7770167.1 helix-turn-helix domain-containing protein [Pasteurella multocida]MCL7774867.1 helix-turn-helix domain-containing protein [Pasteurella multocida]MCL7794253.1 helix-turn-helix domain-containing protein [Pasteurella multocida]MCO5921200.1 helix-turn-helix domain-containing protein [Pasteurella multocida]MDY0572775.1 helix-turn-helix domain-containing protein [Pasteurella multocida]
MSSKLLGHVWDLDLPDHATKLVLLRLADSANDETGECWPSLKHIQDKCNIKSKNTIRRALEVLEQLGLLVVIKRKLSAKQNTSNLYRLNIKKILEPSSVSIKLGGGSNSELGGSNSELGGSNSELGGGSNSEPRTNNSFEPINELNTPLPPKVENSNDLENAFDVFWKVYKAKLNKSGALKSFKSAYKKYSQKTQKSAPQEFAEMLVCDVQKRLSLGQFGFDKLHPTTYLNNARWEDEYTQPAQFKGGQPANDSYQDDGSWAVNSVIVQDGDGKVRVVDRDCEVVL